MATPLAAGLGVAAAALVSRELVKQYVKFKAAPAAARAFYKGGFQQEMTRREAALILGLRESAAADRIKEAHRRIMTANHPDQGLFPKPRLTPWLDKLQQQVQQMLRDNEVQQQQQQGVALPT